MSTTNKLSDKRGEQEKAGFFEKLNDFLRTYRMVILAGLGLIIISIVGIGIYSAVSESRLNSATALLEKIEADFGEWQNAVDLEKDALAIKILEESENLAGKFGSLYPAMRALNLGAAIQIQREDFAAARVLYVRIYTTAPKSHLAPVAMYNAAIMAEKLGDLDSAISLYEKLTNEFPDSFNANRTAFNLARLYEAKLDFPAAYQTYTKIIVKGAADDWTKLAQSRIIYFDAKGIGK
jgi:tetratricopeptide (TPR) repeat protein